MTDEQYDEASMIEREDRETAEAQARDEETARSNDLWDAGAEARERDQSQEIPVSTIGSYENPICHASTPNTLADRWYHENGEVFIWTANAPNEIRTRASDQDWFRLTGQGDARLTKGVAIQ